MHLRLETLDVSGLEMEEDDHAKDIERRGQIKIARKIGWYFIFRLLLLR